MSRTADLRCQHDAATRLVARIMFRIEHFEDGDDAYPIGLDLAKLHGLLRIHLTQEDVVLYPAMIGSGDTKLAMIASRFAIEMGDLADQFERFVRRWGSSAVIGARFDHFRSEALAIFAALETRIDRENDELYPLADTLSIVGMRSAA